MNFDLDSIDDIDAELEKELGISEQLENFDEDADLEVDTNTYEDDNELLDNENDNELNSDEVDDEGNEEEQDKLVKPEPKNTKDEQKSYAFNKMRAEIANLKNENAKNSQESAFLKELALSYGYNDVEQFQKAVKTANMEREAKNKGMDPEIYRQLAERDERIADLEKRNKEADLLSKGKAFGDAISSAATEYGVSRDDIFQRLENAGYDVDIIFSLPDPSVVIKGVLTDVILENSKQKDLKRKETLDNLADNKHNDNSNGQKVMTIDELLDLEMKDYEANYL